jgi:hypothetical protein
MTADRSGHQGSGNCTAPGRLSRLRGSTRAATAGSRKFLIVMAMTFGLTAHAVRARTTLPRMMRHDRSMRRSAVQE